MLKDHVLALENRGKSLEQQLSDVIQDTEQLKKNIPPITAEPETPTAVKKPPTDTPQETGDKPLYHEVKRGETLYRIGKMYRLSVDELRRFNNLTPEQHIFVGQKIFLSPLKE